MWAKIITIKRTKDLNYLSLCAFNLFKTRVSQFELNYWNKWTFPQHSNLLKCTCIYTMWPLTIPLYIYIYIYIYTYTYTLWVLIWGYSHHNWMKGYSSYMYLPELHLFHIHLPPFQGTTTGQLRYSLRLFLNQLSRYKVWSWFAFGSFYCEPTSWSQRSSKELSIQVKQTIVRLQKQNKSTRKIARTLGVAK